MSYLLRLPNVSADDAALQRISPEDAGWEFVGFSVFKVGPGQTIQQSSGNNELCIVLLSGKADIQSRHEKWSNIGDRMSVFEQIPPYAVYIPPNDDCKLIALTDVEFAICSAPAVGKYPAHLIRPSDCEYKPRGSGTNKRMVCNILFDDQDAERLLVVEVITPGGHWSSYPPHKHDSDDPGNESQLEETYYHKLNPPQGFVCQRVYTDDRSIDETLSAPDGSVVLVPKGYHPVGVPHGYESYYLNTMAGPERKWIFRNDPAHEWIIEK